jgi:hypothetical protein
VLKAHERGRDEERSLMIHEDALLNTGKSFVEQFNKQMASGGIPERKPPNL